MNNNIFISFSQDVRCQYERTSGPSFAYLETTPLLRLDNTVYCQCNVVMPSMNYAATLPSDLTGHCSLIMTVCT